MSKKKRKAGGAKSGGVPQRSERVRWAKAAVVAPLLLCVLAAGAASLRWQPVRRAVGLAPLSEPLAQATPTPLLLSKEYVYAGGRLVATEEPDGSPAAPGNLRIPNNHTTTTGGVWKGSLAWDDNSANETGFKVEKKASGQSIWSQIAQVGQNVTGYSISGSCGDAYRVRATNAVGDSAYSNEAYACMETQSTGPAGLLATAVGATSVSVSWTAPSGTIDHYEVERRQSINDQFALLTTCAGTVATDNTASSDTAYLYRVRAVFSGGSKSDYSDSDLATTVIFSDDPLVGSNDPHAAAATVIKADHLKELRRAVSAVHALAGLGAVTTWTYPDPVSSPASSRRPVYLEDVTDLRDRLTEALPRLGITPPTYAPLQRNVTKVGEDHFQQLRNAVK